MKHYLYHKVPEDMTGTTIYPLTTLKDISFEQYSEALKKYGNREHLLERRIPPLNCLWNDVVFLLAVHPGIINKAIENAGLRSPKDFGYSYFKIDLDTLHASLLATFLHTADDALLFSSFDQSKMQEYSQIPKAQHEYYEARRKMTRPYYLFASRTFHILYKGNIDVTNCEIISL